MKNYTQHEIEKLQNSLSLIRRAGGWTAEEFGEMIGVTKQTISNIENKRSKLTKTQYIAIRTVLDYKMAERPDDKLLSSTIALCLNADNLTEEELKKAQSFVSGAMKAKLDTTATIAGLATLLGVVVAESLLLAPTITPAIIGLGTPWIKKIIQDK